MPESKKRKKAAYTAPQEKIDRTPVRIDSQRWVPILMTVCFVLGLLWIVLWYLAPGNPVQGPLGSWNVLVGFVFITVGFFFATRWR
jgi:hypothetical protein